MKLKEVGDLANLLAAVGVIISLLFVGYEIRQNTSESRAAGAAAVGDNLREVLLTRAQSPSLAEAVEAGRTGESMTVAQDSQYRAYMIALIRTVEDAYIQYEAGRLSEDQLNVRLAAARFDLGGEARRERREQFRRAGIFSDSFMQWLEEHLGDGLLEAESSGLESEDTAAGR